jgi:hypothetical protein
MELEKIQGQVSAPWRLEYYDGAGNGYSFSRQEGQAALFEFSPLTPEMSSSGLYSGGRPSRGALTEVQVTGLWEWFEKLLLDASGHCRYRMKGTGCFLLKSSVDSAEFIFKASPMLRQFEESLGPFRA